MKLKDQIDQDLKRALKQKEGLVLSVLRLLKNALHNKEIEKRKALSSEEEVEVLRKEIKKRKEAIFEYQKANRLELVDKEGKEVEILEKYLPKQLSEVEIKRLVKKAISETKATSLSEMGRVMGKIMPQIKGQAEGQEVAKIVKRELGG